MPVARRLAEAFAVAQNLRNERAASTAGASRRLMKPADGFDAAEDVVRVAGARRAMPATSSVATSCGDAARDLRQREGDVGRKVAELGAARRFECDRRAAARRYFAATTAALRRQRAQRIVERAKTSSARDFIRAASSPRDAFSTRA